MQNIHPSELHCLGSSTFGRALDNISIALNQILFTDHKEALV